MDGPYAGTVGYEIQLGILDEGVQVTNLSPTKIEAKIKGPRDATPQNVAFTIGGASNQYVNIKTNIPYPGTYVVGLRYLETDGDKFPSSEFRFVAPSTMFATP